MPEEYRATIDELFIRTQPAHLQKDFERKLTTEERDGPSLRPVARTAQAGSRTRHEIAQSGQAGMPIEKNK